jgi:hypothetical protein
MYWREYVNLLAEKKKQRNELENMPVWDEYDMRHLAVLSAEIKLIEEFIRILERIELGD